MCKNYLDYNLGQERCGTTRGYQHFFTSDASQDADYAYETGHNKTLALVYLTDKKKLQNVTNQDNQRKLGNQTRKLYGCKSDEFG